MIIDFHTHVFFDQVRFGRERFLHMDAGFARIYGDERARMVGVEDLLLTMDEEGVDISVVCGFPWRDIHICRDHNDYIIDAVKSYGDRIAGIACVSPALGKTGAKEVERCIKAGMKGVGEIASYDEDRGSLPLGFLEPVAGILAEHGGFILLHVTEQVGHAYPGKDRTRLDRIYQLVCRFPRVDFVLAHWGGGIFFYELMPEVQKAFKRVYYDTAASPFLYVSKIYRVADQILRSGKVVFGSDFPLIRPRRYFREIEEAGLSAEAVEGIFGRNAQGLLGLSDGTQKQR